MFRFHKDDVVALLVALSRIPNFDWIYLPQESFRSGIPSHQLPSNQKRTTATHLVGEWHLKVPKLYRKYKSRGGLPWKTCKLLGRRSITKSVVYASRLKCHDLHCIDESKTMHGCRGT